MPSTYTVHTLDAERKIVVPTADELSTIDTESDFAQATGNGSNPAGLYARQDGGWERVNDPTEIDHDQLANYVANEHVDHSTVDVTAGTLLTGGGDLTQSRTLNVDEGAISHDGIDQATVSADDHHAEDHASRHADGGADSFAGQTLVPSGVGTASTPVADLHTSNQYFNDSLTLAQSAGDIVLSDGHRIDPDDTTDIGQAIQDAINYADTTLGGEATIWLPPVDQSFSTPITVPNSLSKWIFVRGAGLERTRLQYTGSGDAFTFDASDHFALGGFTLTGDGTAGQRGLLFDDTNGNISRIFIDDIAFDNFDGGHIDIEGIGTSNAKFACGFTNLWLGKTASDAMYMDAEKSIYQNIRVWAGVDGATGDIAGALLYLRRVDNSKIDHIWCEGPGGVAGDPMLKFRRLRKSELTNVYIEPQNPTTTGVLFESPSQLSVSSMHSIGSSDGFTLAEVQAIDSTTPMGPLDIDGMDPDAAEAWDLYLNDGGNGSDLFRHVEVPTARDVRRADHLGDYDDRPSGYAPIPRAVSTSGLVGWDTPSTGDASHDVQPASWGLTAQATTNSGNAGYHSQRRCDTTTTDRVYVTIPRLRLLDNNNNEVFFRIGLTDTSPTSDPANNGNGAMFQMGNYTEQVRAVDGGTVTSATHAEDLGWSGTEYDLVVDIDYSAGEMGVFLNGTRTTVAVAPSGNLGPFISITKQGDDANSEELRCDGLFWGLP